MTQILGINVPASIVPFTTEDIYPTHDSFYGKGGWREVTNASIIPSISSARLDVGMVVVCQDTLIAYQYTNSPSDNLVVGNITLNGWRIFKPNILEDLTDITITTPINGQVLSWNGSSWVNKSISIPSLALSNLTDVHETILASSQVLTYNGAYWTNSNLPSYPSALSEQNDVSIPAPQSNQVLTYDTTISKWIAQDPYSGLINLSQMHDVNIGMLNNGDFLRYNSSLGQWQNQSLQIPLPITSLVNLTTDVLISSPTVGQVLTWNGTDWTNTNVIVSDPRIAPNSFTTNPTIQASITGSMSIGDGAILNSFNSLAIGYAAQVYDPAIGVSGTVIPDGPIWGFGFHGPQLNIPTPGTGNYSIAIGYQASSLSAGSVAIGAGASVSNNYGTVLGYGAQILGSQYYNFVTNTWDTLNAQYGTAIGFASRVGGSNSIAIGANVSSLGSNSIAIGSTEYSSANNTISIGGFGPGYPGDTIIGFNSSAVNAITIGENSQMTCTVLVDSMGNQPIASCLGSHTYGNGNIHGSYSTALTWDCNVLGSMNNASQESSTAIGSQCLTEIPGELAYNVGTFKNNIADNQNGTLNYGTNDLGSTKISWIPLAAVTSPTYGNSQTLNPVGSAKTQWNVAGYTGNGFTLDNNCVYIIELDINAISNNAYNNGLYAAYTTKFSVFTKIAGSFSPIISPIIITTLSDTSTSLTTPWTIGITVDNLNRVFVTVTGDGVNTVRWFAKAELTKLKAQQ